MNISSESKRSSNSQKELLPSSNTQFVLDYPLSKWETRYINSSKKLESIKVENNDADVSQNKNDKNNKNNKEAEIQNKETEIRLYQIWPGKNRFLFWGRIIFGPSSDNFYLILTWSMVLIFSLLYYLFVCPFIFYSIGYSLPIVSTLLLVVSISSLFLSAFIDPGIIPRREIFEIFGPVPKKYGEPNFDNDKDKDKNKNLNLKYCPTCHIFRPPRSSHCSHCDNCVKVFDHHCPFTGNCVGKRNYRYFIILLISLIAYGILVIIQVIITIFKDTPIKDQTKSILQNDIVLYIILILVIIPLILLQVLVIILCIYHMVLSWKGQTTKEFKTKAELYVSGNEQVDICTQENVMISYRAIISPSQLEIYNKKMQQNNSRQSVYLNKLQIIDDRNVNNPTSQSKLDYNRYEVNFQDGQNEFKFTKH